MLKYTYDIFVAYHGTYSKNGSYSEAKKIAEYLRDKGYKVYIFEEKNGDSWNETPKFIIESKVMVIVMNDDVLVDGNDLISKERELANSKEPYQLYVELSTFKSQVNSGERSAQTLNFVYCGNDMNSDEARKFCNKQTYGIPSLNNIIAADYIDEKNEYTPILNWVENALNIQENFGNVKFMNREFNTCNEQNLINDLFVEIENEMFTKNCVAVFGHGLNDSCLNFNEGFSGNFFSCCQELLNRGRNYLNDALEKNFDNTKVSKYIQRLVKFPFSAFLTTDEFSNISLALKIAGKDGVLIKNDVDVYSLDIQKGQIPIFELSRTDVWRDDCCMPSDVISTIIKMLLRGRRIIYIGYNQSYDGYKRIGNVLRSLLGDDFFTCTNNIAIVENPAAPKIYLDKESNFTIINISVEEFTNKLESSNELFKKLVNMNDGTNNFVVDLFKIASTPTETQAIKLLLEQLSFDVQKGMSLEEILDKYDKNVSCLKAIKPNFNAFEKCWLDIKQQLTLGEIDSIRDIEDIVDQVIAERKLISKGIRKQGKYNLNSNVGKNILLYSQSLRVVEYLVGASESFQKNSHLWICECRPKSDRPFRDAINTCELLKKSNISYNDITIIPDMAAFNLMSRGLVDIVVLGAHDVVFYDEMPISFINTCGSIALMRLAKQYKIDVHIVAESGKFTKAECIDGKLKYVISYGHESTIYNDLEFALWAKKEEINTKNIGYDFCNFYKGVKLISEKDCIICSDIDTEIDLIDKTKGSV